MPIYEYQCTKCGQRFEKLCREYLPEPPACPECGAPTQQMPTVAAFILNGPGFYQTDYGRKKDGKRNDE